MSECCSVKTPVIPAAVAACPECGNRSKKVGAITVKSLVRRLPLGMAPAQYYFCEAPACGVVYFPSDPQAPTFHKAALLVRVGVKEEHDPVPVCYCFGVARRDISDEVQRTGKSTIAERIKAEVKAGNCACEVKNPSGKCCLGTVVLAAQDALRAGDVISTNR